MHTLLEVVSGGAASPEAQRHVEACEDCRDALRELRAALEAEARIQEMLGPRRPGLMASLSEWGSSEWPEFDSPEARPHTGLGRHSRGPESSAVGQRLPERYQAIELLGEGGAGAVFLARDVKLGRLVAVKQVGLGRADPLARARMLREARAAASLRHDHLVAVYEVEDPPDGPPCLVMEYVEGRTLEARIREKHRLAPREAARVVREVADGLAAAHAARLVHRDVKPGNILLERATGRAKLADFGLARSEDDADRLTREGAVVGTPSYMSPEQVLDPGRVDARSDVYALGVVLYEALTGERPFRGTTARVLRQVVDNDPDAPRRLNEAIPKDLETVCLKAMAKKPFRRYPSAGELRDDLDRFLNHRPILARPMSWREKSWMLARRHPAKVALGAVSVLLLLFVVAGLLGFLLVERRHLIATKAILAREEHQRRVAERYRYANEVRRALHQVRAGQLDLAQSTLHQFEDPASGDDLREFSWWWLWGRLDREVSHLWGHRTEVNSLAVSSDGRTLASGAGFGEILLWDLATGRVRTRFGRRGSDPAPIASVTLSPDGGSLAAVTVPEKHDSVEFQFWDRRRPDRSWHRTVKAGQQCRFLIDSQGRPHLVVFPQPPGNAREPLGVWELDTENDEAQARVRRVTGWGVMYDHGQPCLVSLKDPGRLVIHDILEGREIRVGVNAVRQSGRAGEELRSPPGFSEAGTTHPWQGLSSKYPAVYRTLLSPQGSLLACAWQDGALTLHDVGTGRKRMLIPALHHGGNSADSSPVRNVHFDFAPDQSSFAAAVTDQLHDRDAVLLWSLDRDAPPLSFPRSLYPVNKPNGVGDVRFLPDGRTLALGGLPSVRLWHWKDAVESRTTPPMRHSPEAWAVAFSPDGRTLASGGDDHRIRLWDPATGAPRADWVAHTSTVSALVYRPDGRVLASASLSETDNVKLWDARTRRLMATLAGHTHDVIALAYRPDGRVLATGGRDRTVRLWDGMTGKPLRILKGHRDKIRSLAFSPDGRVLASVSADTTVRLWEDGAERRPWAELSLGSPGVAIAFSPDGALLAASGEDGSITLWEAVGWGEIRVTPGDESEVRALAFSPDGRTLAAARMDHTIQLIEPTSGLEMLRLEGHTGQVNGLAFSPDGWAVASSGHEGEVRLWKAETGRK